MKTLHTYVEENSWHGESIFRPRLPAVPVSVREILALWVSVGMATMAVLTSIALAATAAGSLIGAGTWALAIGFFASAVDADGRKGLLQALTGMLLIAFAWLQNTVSPDYTIGTGILMAAWISVAVFKRLK